MIRWLHLQMLRVFRRLPRVIRRRIVRTVAPSYTVGAVCVIEDKGRVLLVRHSYRVRWGIPGGLVERGERSETAARREVLEEVCLPVELIGDPAVVVDADVQRVDVIYDARPARDADLDLVRPSSPEILEARWFPRDSLPELTDETSDAFVALARRSVASRSADVLRLRRATG